LGGQRQGSGSRCDQNIDVIDWEYRAYESSRLAGGQFGENHRGHHSGEENHAAELQGECEDGYRGCDHAGQIAANRLSATCRSSIGGAPDGFANMGREYGRTPKRLPLLMRLPPYTAPKPLLWPTIHNAYEVPGTLTEKG
jgi:hypothetical protein